MNLKKISGWNIKNLQASSPLIPVLAFFALAFVVFYIGCSFHWSGFSARDISRAEGWLNGQFYWPGPEM
ncbi:MAG: hypothetical protein OXJ52_09120 [Oligoflexia bacterium]|nr:hypothetical protein [Oligoflexia bacterium]